jgi:arylsulfatase A-like enzyme
MTEFVDIFPTLCDLASIPVPTHLDGKSLVPIMKKPDLKVKEYSVSQYPRGGSDAETGRLGYAEGKCMGYSIRTDSYRYTIWMKDNFRTNRAFDQNLVVATELYDYQKDPDETINVIDEKSYAVISKDLKTKMLEYFEGQRLKLTKK